MKKLLLILICLPIIGIGQSHFINQYNLQMNGNINATDISINTYYNSIDTCNISWRVIKDSIPSQWEFSFCFPTCFVTGIFTGQDIFFPNENIFLNCHVYPNGQEGSGIIQMEITTNNLYKDTVTWISSISSLSTTKEQISNKRLYKVTDILGKETTQANQPLFYIYDDGTVDKRIVIE